MEPISNIEVDRHLWERVLSVAPLVLVGTREPVGGYDLAPKHRIVQLSDAHFGFVCSARHATYRNAVRAQAFTVSWPHPGQVVMTAAASAPRCEDGDKKTLGALPTLPATAVDGVLLEGARFAIECETDRIVGGFGDDELIVGRVVAAHADPDALRCAAQADDDLVRARPLLAYLHPSQFATVDHSTGFPFPKDFSR